MLLSINRKQRTCKQLVIFNKYLPQTCEDTHSRTVGLTLCFGSGRYQATIGGRGNGSKCCINLSNVLYFTKCECWAICWETQGLLSHKSWNSLLNRVARKITVCSSLFYYFQNKFAFSTTINFAKFFMLKFCSQWFRNRMLLWLSLSK